MCYFRELPDDGALRVAGSMNSWQLYLARRSFFGMRAGFFRWWTRGGSKAAFILVRRNRSDLQATLEERRASPTSRMRTGVRTLIV